MTIYQAIIIIDFLSGLAEVSGPLSNRQGGFLIEEVLYSKGLKSEYNAPVHLVQVFLERRVMER